jgi:hypothetical protein
MQQQILRFAQDDASKKDDTSEKWGECWGEKLLRVSPMQMLGAKLK